MKKKLTGTLFVFVLFVLSASCGEVGRQVEEKLNEFNDKTEALDSLVNHKLDKVITSDSLINTQADRVKRLDSIANEKKNILEMF